MAKIRVNHFGAKTIGVGNTVHWESVLMELLIGFLSATFAYMGYQANLALILIPCAIISVTILGLYLYSFVTFILEKFKPKESEEKS